MSVTRQMQTSAATQKLSTISSWRNLRVISTPPSSTKGSILAVPTHQLADSPSTKAVITTAIAAGLKICLLLIARMYLEVIARIAAQPRNWKVMGELAGSIIRARIRAVIEADSRFVGTSKTWARTVFMAQHIMSRNAVDNSSDSGEKCSKLKYARMIAMPTRPIRTYSTTRYIVMRSKSESTALIID